MKRLSLGGLAAIVILAFCSFNVIFLAKLGESQTIVNTLVARDDFASFRGKQAIKVDSELESILVKTRALPFDQPTPRQRDPSHVKVPIIDASIMLSQDEHEATRVMLVAPSEVPRIPQSTIHRGVIVPDSATSTRTVIANNTASLEYSDVCFYGSTRFFFDQNTTKQFVMNFLTVLRDVSLRSFNEALIAKNKVHVLLPISSFEPHFQSVDDIVNFLKPVVDTYTKLEVTFAPNAHEIAKQRFTETDCEWVVLTMLDADDVIFPGYLDWIAQKVIPTLNRGAVVGGQQMNHLQIGYDLCMVETDIQPRHWAGESTGQTRVIRRDVFDRLGNPFEAPTHTGTLTALRRKVFRMLFKDEPLPVSLLLRRKARLNFTLQKLWDADLENITGIRMVEPSLTSEPFGPPSVYLKSPLSAHFFYEKIVNMSRCTISEWASVWEKAMNQNVVKSNMDYIYTTLQGINFSIYDSCKSHSYFSEVFAGTSNRAWFGNATTCEEMEAKLRETLLLYQ
ncbi:hypothetical protein MHU86_20159 [Fragilaria crotonensis]|nr:hypothetical protein MHU86_20159 [Fragilaria crotonensis]